MNRLYAYVRLMRPVNCLMMGFAVLVGAVLATSAFSLSVAVVAYGVVTGFTLTAASMAMNDYYDREIDAVNEPTRPIPSGSIKPEEAVALSLLLAAVGLAAAYLTNISCLLTAAASLAVFAGYTVVGKRSGLFGNLLVSTCVAIPFVYGSLLAVGYVGTNVLVFATIAFLSNTGREITKGIVDVQGDAKRGIRTLAVRYGERKAAVAAALFYVGAIVLSPVPWILGVVSFWFVPLVIVTDLGLLAASVMLLRDTSRENARRIKRMVLYFFLVGLVAFVVGSVS